MPGQWTSRERIHLCVHLPAIHAYTNSASSIANRDRDSNSYTYFDTETFTDTKSCANAQGSSYSAAAPVTFRFAQSIGPHKPTFPIPKTQSAFPPRAQRNAFRPGVRRQSRSFAPRNQGLRPSPNSNLVS